MPIDYVLQILLTAGTRLRIELVALDPRCDFGQAAPPSQHFRALAAIPTGVALGENGVELAVLDQPRRRDQRARAGVEAADMAIDEVDRLDRLAAHLGVEIEPARRRGRPP